jgi:predicted DNA-binding transcriptional regulator AlpA
VFREFPDDDDGTDEAEAPAAPEPGLPPDDTMLRAKDVVRLTGLSLSILMRMVLDGRFAKPMRLSPRRIGWLARDARAWLDGLDGARRKVRS